MKKIVIIFWILSAGVVFSNAVTFQWSSISSQFFFRADSPSPSFCRQRVPGWNAHRITNASVSGASSDEGNYNFDQLKKRPVKAVFTYAHGGGGDTYNLKKVETPDKTQNLIKQARKLEEAYGHQQQVMPLIVVYTAGGSSGAETVNIDLGQDAHYADNLWQRYYNLIRIAQVAESYKDVEHTVPATLLLNPDLLGEIHKSCQEYYCPVAYQTMAIPVASALLRAFTELHTDGYLDNMPDIPLNMLSDQLHLAGYIDSVNWLIKTFSPSIAFGWQDNIWAGDPLGHRWIHKAATETSSDFILRQHIYQEFIFLKELKIFNIDNPYRPHFIAFDKWERDNWDSSLQGAGINQGYLYNAPAWQVYFGFIKGISQALQDFPVMLFQIPGGHMQVCNDLDSRNDHGSTAPDYILGDRSLAPELSNVKDYMMDAVLKAPTRDYYIKDSSVRDYLKACPKGHPECANGYYRWHDSHWQSLFNMNVFSILWGGGSTTSIVGLTKSLDDNGWLHKKLTYQDALSTAGDANKSH